MVLANAGDAVGTVTASLDDAAATNLELKLSRYPEIATALETQRPVLVRDAATDPLFSEVRALWASEGVEVRIRSVLTLPFAIDRWRHAQQGDSE